jgi:glutamine amidotransferase
LNLISGEVIPLNNPRERGRRLKVPHVGWNRIHAYGDAAERWAGTALEGFHDGEFMYFVHSFVVVPEDRSVVLSTSVYGDIEFCSSVSAGPIFACQFHPERSGRRGLHVYDNLRATINASLAERRTSA